MTDFTPIDPDGGLILATTLPGRAEDLLRDAEAAWASLGAGTPDAPVWVHLDRTKERAQRWVREQAGLDEMVAESLLAEETRPRFAEQEGGILVILRGVNMNPGAQPDDLIALRLWIEPGRVISLRAFRFNTIVEMRKRAQSGRAPATPGAFLAAIARGLASRLGPVVENLDAMLDDVEADLIDKPDADGDRSLLATIRRQAITYRRYMVPQRDAMRGLALLDVPVLSKRDQAELRHAAEQVTRVVEDFEELRDRAAVTSDEIRSRREARLSKTTYLLTVVATVALPLGLLTGLLGINVGGMPGADNRWAFAIVCAVMLIVAGVEIWMLRKLRWL
ncbi:MAG: zinc transporter ZntB [Phycisphaerales bacterium]